MDFEIENLELEHRTLSDETVLNSSSVNLVLLGSEIRKLGEKGKSYPDWRRLLLGYRNCKRSNKPSNKAQICDCFAAMLNIKPVLELPNAKARDPVDIPMEKRKPCNIFLSHVRLSEVHSHFRK